eukprot:6149386-Pleurochrysis_carterae.AAC.1
MQRLCSAATRRPGGLLGGAVMVRYRSVLFNARKWPQFFLFVFVSSLLKKVKCPRNEITASRNRTVPLLFSSQHLSTQLEWLQYGANNYSSMVQAASKCSIGKQIHADVRICSNLLTTVV